MEDRVHLYDQERLLCSMRPSAALLFRDFPYALLNTLIIGVPLLLLFGGAWWSFTGALPPAVIDVVVFLIVFIGVCLRRIRQWRHASFRITTDRILINHHETLFSHPLKTIKWSQYQESVLGRRTLPELLFGVRPIVIRYGNADAQLKVSFPALPYAEDLKHYLDKVDSAVRRKETSEAVLKTFVAKPRGKRD